MELSVSSFHYGIYQSPHNNEVFEISNLGLQNLGIVTKQTFTKSYG
jgi:hypothetical protein